MPLKYNPFTGKLDWVNTKFWEINDDDRLAPVDDVDVEVCCDLYVGGNILTSVGLNFVPGGVDLYISTTGSDATGDGSVSNPWATFSKLVTEMSRYRSNGTITGHIGNGTYSQTVEVEIPTYAAGDWSITGNTSSPTSVVLDGEDTNPTTGHVIFRHENPAVNLTISGANLKRAFICINVGNTNISYSNLQFDDYRYAINSSNANHSAFGGTPTLTFNGYTSNGTIAIRLLDGSAWSSTCNLRFTKNRYDIVATSNCNVRLQQSVGSTYVSTLDATYGTNSINASRLSSVEIAVPMTLDGNNKGTNAILLDSKSRMYSFGGYTHSISNFTRGFYFGIYCFVQEPVNSTWNFTNTDNEITADQSVIIESADNLDCTITWFDPASTTRGYDYRYVRIGYRENVRITSADSPYSLVAGIEEVFANTDDGDITINLPEGTNKEYHRIINCGSSGNDVTVTPDGSEKLNGTNTSETLIDGEKLILTYETTEGWY